MDPVTVNFHPRHTTATLTPIPIPTHFRSIPSIPVQSNHNLGGSLETEMVTVEYKPILGVEIMHRKQVEASVETIVGMALVAMQVVDLDRFSIERKDGTRIDIAACFHLPYVVPPGQPVTLPFTAKFLSTKVQFTSPDFITGAFLVCQLLGIGWTSIISNISLLDPKFYLGEIEVEPLETSGGSLVGVRYLEYFLWWECGFDGATIRRMLSCRSD